MVAVVTVATAVIGGRVVVVWNRLFCRALSIVQRSMHLFNYNRPALLRIAQMK